MDDKSFSNVVKRWESRRAECGEIARGDIWKCNQCNFKDMCNQLLNLSQNTKESLYIVGVSGKNPETTTYGIKAFNKEYAKHRAKEEFIGTGNLVYCLTEEDIEYLEEE